VLEANFSFLSFSHLKFSKLNLVAKFHSIQHYLQHVRISPKYNRKTAFSNQDKKSQQTHVLHSNSPHFSKIFSYQNTPHTLLYSLRSKDSQKPKKKSNVKRGSQKKSDHTITFKNNSLIIAKSNHYSNRLVIIARQNHSFQRYQNRGGQTRIEFAATCVQSELEESGEDMCRGNKNTIEAGKQSIIFVCV
jgi:hypothetical protein